MLSSVECRSGLSFQRKDLFVDEVLPESNSLRFIDAKHGNGRPTGLSAADKPGATPEEMSIPVLSARMKQENDIACLRVYS